MSRLLILLAISVLLTNGLYADDDWTQKFPATKPSSRAGHAMAYVGGDRALLFGGDDGSYDDETWVYDLSDNLWLQQSTSLKPSARYYHAMAYIGGDQVLLFGGIRVGGHSDETWIYDLSDNSWTQQSPSTNPSARYYHSMAYIGGDQVLLFGGFDGSYYNDTWIYDLSEDSWTQKNPSDKPSARDRHKLAYIGGDQVLLFGGYDGGISDRTWIYDLSDDNWTLKSPTSKPSARFEHDMAYIGGDQVLLFGGYDAAGRDDETWIYDLSDNNWTKDLNTTQPSARYLHALSETSMDGTSYPLLFGGYPNAGYNDETWTFGGGDYPIPVELTAFTATVNDGAVILNWTTQTETENYGFHVYRSQFEDRDYVKITQSIIPGAGSSEVVHFYSYTDATVERSKTYYYKLAALDYNGNVDFHGPITVMVTSVGSISASKLPDGYTLGQNYPNPFNPETAINFSIKEAGKVSLKIFNLQGRLISSLVDADKLAGSYSVTWNGTDDQGVRVSSGIYLYTFRVNGFEETKKLTFMK